MRVIRIGCASAAMMAMLTASAVGSQANPAKTETRVVTRPIPFKVTFEVSRLVSAGRTIVSREGKNGQVIDTYTVSFKNGQPVSKTLVSTQTVQPSDEVVTIGQPPYAMSRHAFRAGRSMNMTATAYDPSPQTIPGTTGRTCTGMRAGYGVIAVDPRVIPLGSIVYVEGYGLAIAADTGGAIKGHRIDLCYDARSTALRFGRHSVKLYILHPE